MLRYCIDPADPMVPLAGVDLGGKEGVGG